MKNPQPLFRKYTKTLFAPGEHAAVLREPMFIFIMVLTIASALGFQSWRTLLNNFMVENAGLDGAENGLIQSVREVPGFMALLVVYLLLVLREHKLAALSILLLGAGVAPTGLFPSVWGLVLTTLLMSFGFHYYETTQQSLTLQNFDQKITPWVMGKQKSYMAATNVVCGLAIFVLTPILSYEQMFLVFGLPVVLVALWAMGRNPVRGNSVPQKKGMVLNKRYSLFYALTFMAGARRQVFVAFAVFLSVERFGFTLQEVTSLFVINNLITYYLSPKVGKAIMRFGERNVLVFEYICLIFVFLGYAFAWEKWQIIALYVLDHVFFSFRIALSTYFQKIAHPQDIVPTVAVAFTINHIAAVAIPVAFGALWMVDYRLPFILGSGMCIISLLFALKVVIPPTEARAPLGEGLQVKPVEKPA